MGRERFPSYASPSLAARERRADKFRHGPRIHLTPRQFDALKEADREPQTCTHMTMKTFWNEYRYLQEKGLVSASKENKRGEVTFKITAKGRERLREK